MPPRPTRRLRRADPQRRHPPAASRGPGGREDADDHHHPGPERSGPRGISYATAGATTFSARDRGTYADPQAYTITYNGAAGTTLNTLGVRLESPLPGNFYPATYAVTTGAAAKSGTTGGTAPAIASSTVSGRMEPRGHLDAHADADELHPGLYAELRRGADRQWSRAVTTTSTATNSPAPTITATDSTGTVRHGHAGQHVLQEVELQDRLRSGGRERGHCKRLLGN